MRTAENKSFLAAALFAICLFASSNHPALAQGSNDAVDLGVVAPDTGTALDDKGQGIPDTGTFVPPVQGQAQTGDVKDAPEPKAVASSTPTVALAILKSGPPEGVFTRGRVTRLVSVKASVRNVGKAPAREVKIFTRLPSGIRIRLNGPDELKIGEVAVYSVDANQTFTVGGNLQVEKSCENCAK